MSCDAFKAIEEHALEYPRVEVCGFLFSDSRIGMVAKRARNIAANPTEEMEIHPDDVVSAYRTGRLLSYYHSHPSTTQCVELSPIDRAVSDQLRMPVLLYSLHNGCFYRYCPVNAIQSYVGRQFIVGYTDCVGLVTDYYQKEYSFTIPFVPRTIEHMRQGYPLTLKILLTVGFDLIVTPSQLNMGDILGFTIGDSPAINHLAVYVGDGCILHHPFNSPSERIRLPTDWCSVMTVLRKPNLRT